MTDSRKELDRRYEELREWLCRLLNWEPAATEPARFYADKLEGRRDARCLPFAQVVALLDETRDFMDKNPLGDRRAVWIARIECATEGTDVLSREVAVACGISWSSDEDGNYGPYNILPMRCRFTTNLGATKTLIKPDVPWEMGFTGDRYWARVGRNNHTRAAQSVTPELALCAAALKAIGG